MSPSSTTCSPEQHRHALGVAACDCGHLAEERPAVGAMPSSYVALSQCFVRQLRTTIMCSDYVRRLCAQYRLGYPTAHTYVQAHAPPRDLSLLCANAPEQCVQHPVIHVGHACFGLFSLQPMYVLLAWCTKVSRSPRASSREVLALVKASCSCRSAVINGRACFINAAATVERARRRRCQASENARGEKPDFEFCSAWVQLISIAWN